MEGEKKAEGPEMHYFFNLSSLFGRERAIRECVKTGEEYRRICKRCIYLIDILLEKNRN